MLAEFSGFTNMAKVILKVIGLLVVLGVLALRAAEVAGSKDGLWQGYPHSGFCPECPVSF